MHDDSHTAAHRATEFVYGTIAAMIVVAGIDIAGGEAPGAAAIILVAAIATWLAHAYAAALAIQLTYGRPTNRTDIRRCLIDAAPIVVAALPATVATLGGTLDFWTAQTGIRLANGSALLVLAAAGWYAARGSGATVVRSALSVVVSVSIGLAIVGIELLAHH